MNEQLSLFNHLLLSRSRVDPGTHGSISLVPHTCWTGGCFVFIPKPSDGMQDLPNLGADLNSSSTSSGWRCNHSAWESTGSLLWVLAAFQRGAQVCKNQQWQFDQIIDIRSSPKVQQSSYWCDENEECSKRGEQIWKMRWLKLWLAQG